MIIRPATPSDVSEIVTLTCMASGGLIDFLFQDLKIDATKDEVLRTGVLDETGELSYRNTDVAVEQDQVVGIATSYPAARHRMTTEIQQLFTAERLKVLQDFYSNRVDRSWYLDTLGVKPEFQRQGIGTQLIQATKEKANLQGFEQLSLMTFADNISAINLYQRIGFEAVKSVQLGDHPQLSHQQGCILMKCDLTS
ncbi:MAG: GNAT family N-acetyltransferase [Microcoleaceae cyanobacterium]